MAVDPESVVQVDPVSVDPVLADPVLADRVLADRAAASIQASVGKVGADGMTEDFSAVDAGRRIVIASKDLEHPRRHSTLIQPDPGRPILLLPTTTATTPITASRLLRSSRDRMSRKGASWKQIAKSV